MKETKRTISFIGIFLGAAILVAGIVLWTRSDPVEDDKQGSSSVDTVTADQIEMFGSYDVDSLINSIKKENHYDERSGFVFHVPDGFTAEDRKEYIILKNDDRPEGCIVVYLYSDMTVSDGIETFDALYGLKDRTAYYIDGHYHKCVLYDVGTFTEEDINGHRCRVEKTKVHLKDLDPADCQAAYYHTAIEGSGVCVGSIVKDDSKDGSAAYFNEQVHEVLNHISAVHYLGDQPGGNAEYMSLSTDTVNGMEMRYPTGWNKYGTTDGHTVYKAKAAKCDQYQNAAILVAKLAAGTDEAFDIYNVLRWRLGHSIGDALCQDPEIENGFSFGSLIQNGQETIEINGYTFTHVTCTGKLDLSEAKKLSTLPDKDDVFVDGYFAAIDHEVHCFLFLGSTVRNDVEMKILGRRCLETIR